MVNTKTADRTEKRVNDLRRIIKRNEEKIKHVHNERRRDIIIYRIRKM